MPKPRKSAFSAPYVALIDELTRRRHELGMTQADLGAAYGENQSFISRVERYQRRIDVYEFVQLCRSLRLRPSAMLDRMEEESAAN